MKKRTISLFLAFVMLLGILPVTSLAAPTLEEAMAEVDIYGKYEPLNWLTMNGSVKTQRYTYYNYESPVTGQVKEIPAYCVDPRLKGVPVLVSDGTPIKYSASETMSDYKLVGIVSNGYPHQSLETLGLKSVNEGYYATKTAVWIYLLADWSIDKLGINPNLSGADKEAAERVLQATKDIYWRGVMWNKMYTPKLTATADRDKAYPVTINKGRSGPQDDVPDHVGIVERVESGVVYTVEGNSSDSCRQRSYSVDHYEIWGYGTPIYN